MLRHAFALQAAAGSSRHGPVLDSIFKEGDAAPPSDAAATADAAAARPAWLLHLGYCNHSVNTDHAWLETTVHHHFHETLP